MGHRKVTMEETEKVHISIEQCLTKYMTKNETERALFAQYNIEPCFTDIIWKRMEDENQAFFKEYYKRLALKEQIVEFNRLLSQQAILISQQESLNDASIVADNRLQMPASGLAENTGPALMPIDAPTVADWYSKCGSYMQNCGPKNNNEGLSLDGGDSRKESLAHPMDMEMFGLHNSQSGYLPYAHNNFTPSLPAIYNPSLPSSSYIGGDFQYANGTLNTLHEERNSWDFYNACLPQDMSNLLPNLNYMGERQSQANNAGSVWHQQNSRFMDFGAGRSNH